MQIVQVPEVFLGFVPGTGNGISHSAKNLVNQQKKILKIQQGLVNPLSRYSTHTLIERALKHLSE